MTKKRHACSNRRALKSLAPTTALIDLKCKRVSSVAVLCDRHEHMWKATLLHLVVHTPVITNAWYSHSVFSPKGQQLTCLVQWDSWGQGQWVIPPLYICAQTYLNDDSHRQGGHLPGDTVNGWTRKTYSSVDLCVCRCACECLCLWSGGEGVTWDCFVEHIICNLSFKSSEGGDLFVLRIQINQ